MKIVADDKIPFLRGVFEPFAEVVYLPGGTIDRAALRDADALITRTRTKCTKALLAGSAVRCVATATIGYDHIDAPGLAELGIAWSNAPGCNANSVAQYVTAALMTWNPALTGLTLGVIGVGHVGSIVARYGEALGMRVLRNDPPRQAAGEPGLVELDRILAESDVVTLHVPLEYAGAFPTFHLADEAFFARLKPGALFINAARGEAADTAAVKAARRSGKIGGVICDVWENEPNIDRELLEMCDLSTMHIAGYSTDGKANGTAAAVQAVARALNVPELFDWRPAVLPAPLQSGRMAFVSLAATVLHTYDPRLDSANLRGAPEKFEAWRGAYPVRREFPAFTVTGAPESAAATLRQLGFRLD